MLDSIFAMKRSALIFFALLFFFLPAPVQAQFALISVASPVAGQVLQGMVTVTGSSAMADFASAEVAFAYPNDPTGTWFLIVRSDQPVTDGILASWDTTLLTDGNYTLRLRVTLADGSTRDVTVPDLRVRNYTPVETATPAPVTGADTTPIPTAIPTATLFPTPTPLPPNPAEVTPEDMGRSLFYGGLVVSLLFFLVWAYLRMRRN